MLSCLTGTHCKLPSNHTAPAAVTATAAGIRCRCLPACGCNPAACLAGVLYGVSACGAAVVTGG